jgi:hypothetical protein
MDRLNNLIERSTGYVVLFVGVFVRFRAPLHALLCATAIKVGTLVDVRFTFFFNFNLINEIYNPPNTEIEVSKKNMLGHHDFGQQIMEAEGHEQMDYEKGVNFWDTAEMYSVPAREENLRDTERIIGTWFKKNRKKRRGGSLKIKGPNPNFTYMRDE